MSTSDATVSPGATAAAPLAAHPSNVPPPTSSAQGHPQGHKSRPKSKRGQSTSTDSNAEHEKKAMFIPVKSSAGAPSQAANPAAAEKLTVPPQNSQQQQQHQQRQRNGPRTKQPLSRRGTHQQQLPQQQQPLVRPPMPGFNSAQVSPSLSEVGTPGSTSAAGMPPPTNLPATGASAAADLLPLGNLQIQGNQLGNSQTGQPLLTQMQMQQLLATGMSQAQLQAQFAISSQQPPPSQPTPSVRFAVGFASPQPAQAPGTLAQLNNNPNLMQQLQSDSSLLIVMQNEQHQQLMLNQHRAQMADLREDHATQMTNLRKDHAAHVAGLKEDHATQVAKLEAELEKTKQVAALNAEANRTLLGAAAAAIRTSIEKLAGKFKRAHQKTTLCTEDINKIKSTTELLHHFETCAMTKDSTGKYKCGQAIADSLRGRLIRPPTKGSFEQAFGELCAIIHSSTMHIRGKRVVPYLQIDSLRFLVRFILSSGDEVLIAEGDGVREPKDYELWTPGGSPVNSPPEGRRGEGVIIVDEDGRHREPTAAAIGAQHAS